MSPESNVLLTAHEIAVQNVHISMEYPCSVRIDVYCQKLGHLGRFLLEIVVLAPAGVLRRGVAGPAGRPGMRMRGAAGKVSPGLVSRAREGRGRRSVRGQRRHSCTSFEYVVGGHVM